MLSIGGKVFGNLFRHKARVSSNSCRNCKKKFTGMARSGFLNELEVRYFDSTRAAYH